LPPSDHADFEQHSRSFSTCWRASLLGLDGAPNDALDLNGQQFHNDNVGGGEGKDITVTFGLRDDYKEVGLLGTSDNAFKSDFPDHPFAITVPPLPED